MLPFNFQTTDPTLPSESLYYWYRRQQASSSNLILVDHKQETDFHQLIFQSESGRPYTYRFDFAFFQAAKAALEDDTWQVREATIFSNGSITKHTIRLFHKTQTLFGIIAITQYVDHVIHCSPHRIREENDDWYGFGWNPETLGLQMSDYVSKVESIKDFLRKWEGEHGCNRLDIATGSLILDF